jgi:hypothetical protein
MKKNDWLNVMVGMITTCCVLLGTMITYAACNSSPISACDDTTPNRACSASSYIPSAGECRYSVYTGKCDTSKENCGECKCKPLDGLYTDGQECRCAK